ncbi:unnamed protein product [Oppiella nova]|uniref:Cysteine dioxygenase n=1 Tax=Oppiella nova TaxID=334625 RepID=A0A7R9QXD2_9ACAR|nr:unnamed protein product [Oppiella nova]CAG2179133.1 unnamed protein product [Oppiella nova]
MPKITTFDDLVDHLRTIFEGNDIDVDYVQNIMLSYRMNTRVYPESGGQRNGKYNLMLVCWSEGPVVTRIHDHSDSHCFMKMLTGSVHEIRYE